MPTPHTTTEQRDQLATLIGRLSNADFDRLSRLDSPIILGAIADVVSQLKNWDPDSHPIIPVAIWTPHVETPILISSLLKTIKAINSLIETWWHHHDKALDNQTTTEQLKALWGELVFNLETITQNNHQDSIRPLDWHQMVITLLSWLDQETENQIIDALCDKIKPTTEALPSTPQANNARMDDPLSALVSHTVQRPLEVVAKQPQSSVYMKQRSTPPVDPTGMTATRGIDTGVATWPHKPSGHTDARGKHLNPDAFYSFDDLWSEIKTHLSHSLGQIDDIDKTWVMRCLQRCGVHLIFQDKAYSMRTGSSNGVYIADEATYSIEGGLPHSDILSHITHAINEAGKSKSEEEKGLFATALSRALHQRRTLGYQVFGIGADNQGQVSSTPGFVTTKTITSPVQIKTLKDIATQMKDSAQTKMGSGGAIYGEALAMLQANDQLTLPACHQLLWNIIRLSALAAVGPHPLTPRQDKKWESVTRVSVRDLQSSINKPSACYKPDPKGILMRSIEKPATGKQATVKPAPRLIPAGMSPLSAIYPPDNEAAQSIPPAITALLRFIASRRKGADSVTEIEAQHAWLIDQHQVNGSQHYEYDPMGSAIYNQNQPDEMGPLDLDGRPFQGLVPINLWREINGETNTCSTWVNKMVTSSALLHHPDAFKARQFIDAICYITLPSAETAPILSSPLVKEDWKKVIDLMQAPPSSDISKDYHEIKQEFYRFIHALILKLIHFSHDTLANTKKLESQTDYSASVSNRLERLLRTLSPDMSYIDLIECYEHIRSTPLFDTAGRPHGDFLNGVSDMKAAITWFFPYANNIKALAAIVDEKLKEHFPNIVACPEMQNAFEEITQQHITTERIPGSHGASPPGEKENEKIEKGRADLLTAGLDGTQTDPTQAITAEMAAWTREMTDKIKKNGFLFLSCVLPFSTYEKTSCLSPTASAALAGVSAVLCCVPCLFEWGVKRTFESHQYEREVCDDQPPVLDALMITMNPATSSGSWVDALDNHLRMGFNALLQERSRDSLEIDVRSLLEEKFKPLSFTPDHCQRLIEQCISSATGRVSEMEWGNLYSDYDKKDNLLTLHLFDYLNATLLQNDDQSIAYYKKLSPIEKSQAKQLIKNAHQDPVLLEWITTGGMKQHILNKKSVLTTLTKAIITHCLPDQLHIQQQNLYSQIAHLDSQHQKNDAKIKELTEILEQVDDACQGELPSHIKTHVEQLQKNNETLTQDNQSLQDQRARKSMELRDTMNLLNALKMLGNGSRYSWAQHNITIKQAIITSQHLPRDLWEAAFEQYREYIKQRVDTETTPPPKETSAPFYARLFPCFTKKYDHDGDVEGLLTAEPEDCNQTTHDHIWGHVDAYEQAILECIQDPINNDSNSHHRLTIVDDTYHQLSSLICQSSHEGITCLTDQIKNALTMILFKQSLYSLPKYDLDRSHRELNATIFHHPLIQDWLIALYQDSDQLYFWRVVDALDDVRDPVNTLYWKVYILKTLINQRLIPADHDWTATPFKTEIQLFAAKHPSQCHQMVQMIDAVLTTKDTKGLKEFIVTHGKPTEDAWIDGKRLPQMRI